MTQPEFSRPLRVDRVPRGGSFEKLAGDAKECAALAERFAIPALHSLTAGLRASPWRGGGLKVAGELVADLDQVSVVSLEPFRSTVTAEVERYFMPKGVAIEADGEAEIDPIVNGEVDLGEVVAESLALALEPYPRKPGEVFEEGPTGEPEAPEKPSPFAALKDLERDPD